MKSLVLHIKKNWPLYILIVASIFLFFFHLDYNTITSWDEGWYASIARDIVRSGDFMNLNWNGKPFYDHPPMGFWLMAITYKFFGINEFSTRFPSAILGVLSMILVYKVGEAISKSKAVGFSSALILMTSVWYLIRVRSGNLDSPFIFFYILTICLSLKSEKDFRWFPVTMLSFGALVMTKTLIGISAGPIIFLLIWRQLLSAKKNIGYFIAGIAGFWLVVYPWYHYHIQMYPDFIEHHFFNIGMRDKTLASYFQLSWEQPLFYIHMGVRKWYKMWLLLAAYLIIRLSFLKKYIFILLLWNIAVLYPFLTSTKTELWHLIPVYLPLSFIISIGLLDLFTLGTKILTHIPYFKKIKLTLLPEISLVIVILIIAFFQMKTFYKEVYPASKYIPDDVEISKEAGRFNENVYLDDDYTPLAVFYADRQITNVGTLPDDRRTLEKLIQSDEKNYVVIARNWAVEDLKKKNIPFKLLKRNNTFSILTKSSL
ncbi:MAG: glycosyltransferase family 39 protein [bacterium]|nr:glycosyltransferase family 39 protein [bacterium]